jgi:hypothetical protein
VISTMVRPVEWVNPLIGIDVGRASPESLYIQ